MYIESIQLNNYRNYDQEKLEFSPGVNIFYGDNAQGKTNLLEAVYLCATARSHRGSKDKEMIKFEEEEAHIRLQLFKEQLSHRLDVHLKNKKSKGIAIDGIPIRKSSELLGFLHVVFFSPEDLSIIKNGPSHRRKFMDMELGQLDGSYLKMLIAYNKLLNERNNLLKQIGFQPSLRETLESWDLQILEYGKGIIEKRERFVVMMESIMGEIHEKLTGEKEKIKVVYEKNVSGEEYEEKLKDSLERDIRTGTTNAGPHRDDLGFFVDGKDLRKFGSQGQQRTAALSLKLSEMKLIEKVSGEKPILLLDDVLSELDHHRQEYLLSSISEIQTMITCTGLEDFVNGRIFLDKIFMVEDGKIREYMPQNPGNAV